MRSTVIRLDEMIMALVDETFGQSHGFLENPWIIIIPAPSNEVRFNS